MPSSFYLVPTCILLSRVRNCIPKKWKQSVEKTCDELMVENLLTTLKHFVSKGNLLKAVRTFAVIHSHVPSSSSHDLTIQSLSSLLLCCTNLKLLTEGKQIHGHAITLGLGQNRFLVPKLVTFYTAFNDLLFSARLVIETSNIFHPLPWNILISAYVRNGQCKEAILSYKRMMSKGIRPDNFTYPSVLKACGDLLDLEFAIEVHKSIDGSPSARNLFVQNALISMYTKCGAVDVARQMFENMPVKDSVSWNSIIAGYASKNIWSEAFQLFERMRKDAVELNIITWNCIASGCLRTGNFKGALELLAQTETSGIQLDPVAVISNIILALGIIIFFAFFNF